MLNKLFKEFNETYGLDLKEPTSEFLFKRELLSIDEQIETLDEICESYEITMTKEPGKPGHMVITSYKLREDIDILAYVKECTDKIYIVGQGLVESGVNLDASLSETHRSNMSKRLSLYEGEVAVQELALARKRYPDAELVVHGSYYVLRDAITGKVIKPTTYSNAQLTKSMIFS